MDKNTITGLVLIFVILVTFSYLNKPSQSEIESAKRQRDSIAILDAEKVKQAEYKIAERYFSDNERKYMLEALRDANRSIREGKR